jgi:hypothetical protein
VPVDYDNLNGPQRGILLRSILAAYPDPFQLQRVLDEQLEWNFSEIVRATNYEQQVYELIKWTTGKGWTDNLIAAIKGDRPDSPPVQRLDSELERAAAGKVPPPDEKVRSDDKVRPEPPPPPPGAPKIVVVLGEPSLPAEAAKGVSQEPVRELLKALRARGVPVAPPEQWADGWAARESLVGLAHFLDELPLFVRTLAPPTGTLVKESKELLKSLLGPFDEQDAARLARCPRLLWRPGTPWSDSKPEPPLYASADPPDALARLLAEMLGISSSEPDIVIHFETPKGEMREPFENALKKVLDDVIGIRPEPAHRPFFQGRLRDLLPRLKGAQSQKLRVLACNDYNVPEPATREKTISLFRSFDQDIDSAGPPDKLVRVAVLVRTADEFNAEVNFGDDARLERWSLLRLSKKGKSEFEPDSDNAEILKDYVAKIRNDAASRVS